LGNLFYCELLKLKRSKILLISFLGAMVTPVMMIVDGIKVHYTDPGKIITLEQMYDSCSLYTMLLFGLIVYVVFAAYLFSREHTEHTLKTILTIPVSKFSFIISKYVLLLIWIIVLTLISWAGISILSAAYSAFFPIAGFSVGIAAKYLGEMLFGGIMMFLTITPFVFLALWTKGLVVPVIAAAAIVMGNVALYNEALGALYPWTASCLLVKGGTAETGYPLSLVTGLIGLVSMLGFMASVIYFAKEDIK